MQRSNLSQHVVYFAPEEIDDDMTESGWFFEDETNSYNGPYETEEQAYEALREYSKTL